MTGDDLDRLSRRLARPMPRRRALGVLAGGAAAVAFPWLRPSRAEAVCGDRDNSCSAAVKCTNGGSPCAIDGVTSTDNCPTCKQAFGCDNSCAGGTGAGAGLQCCKGTDHRGDPTAWCCTKDEACSQEEGCSCPSERFDSRRICLPCGAGRRCGTICCKPDEICTGGAPNPVCKLDCLPTQRRCGTGCCPSGMECGGGAGVPLCVCRNKCGSGCCPDGSTCVGSAVDEGGSVTTTCLGPYDPRGVREPVSREYGRESPLGLMGAPDTTAFRGAEAAASAPRVSLLLGAVVAQGNYAARLFASPQIDKAYKSPVKATTPKLPKAATAGLSSAATAEVDKLVSVEARAGALLLAAARCRGRTLGALKAKDMKRAKQQSLAAAGFARSAAALYAQVPDARASAASALKSAGAADPVTSAADVAAYQARLKAGIPSDLRRLLTTLGLTASDQARVRADMLATDPNAATGRWVVDRLADTQTAKTPVTVAKFLRGYAKAAKTTPITTTKPTTTSTAVPA
jgi:hypothetical protein